MKKEKIEKKIETIAYGILSLMFGMAFFFGVLYPEYGVSSFSYRVVENNPCCKVQEAPFYEPQGCVTFPEQLKNMDSSQIRYKSYFYERLKNR